MPRIEYSKTIIYRLHCNTPGIQKDIFGYTGNLKCFKYNLKRDCTNNKNTELCNTIRENGGVANWDVIEMERFTTCKNKKEALLRVKEIETEFLRQKLPQNSAVLPIFPAVLPNFEANFSDHGKEENKLSNKTCAFCSKVFSRRSHMLVHQEKSCKNKKPQEFFEKLERQLADQQQKIEEQKVFINKLESQLTTVGGSNNNNNIQNSNNTQNIQNNNIIIELGNENFSEFLTDRQKLKILEQKYTSLDFFIRNFHCNPKYPQFQCLKIPSLTKSHCEVFSEKHKKYIAKNINDCVEQLVDCRVGDIQSFLEDTPNVPEKTEKAVRDMVDKIGSDTKYKKDKFTKIKMDIYNKFRKTSADS